MQAQIDTAPKTANAPIKDEIGYRYVFSPNVDPEKIVQQYRGQAAGYDANMRRWEFLTPRQSTGVLRAHISPLASILEAGCGTGLSGEAHSAAGYKNLHGIDISPEMLEVAKTKGIYQSLKRGNLLERLPYDTGSFDASVCVAVLTHITDAEPLLRELCRIVKPGGEILFSQRKDLFETRNMEALLAKLETEGKMEKVSQSEWLPYVTNQEDYVKCGITVGYFVYRVK